VIRMNIYTKLNNDIQGIVDMYLDNYVYVEIHRPNQSVCIYHLTRVLAYMKVPVLCGAEPMLITAEFGMFMGRSIDSFPSRIEIEIFLYNYMFGGDMVRGEGYYPDKTLLTLADIYGPIIGMNKCCEFEERIISRHIRRSYVGHINN